MPICKKKYTNVLYISNKVLYLYSDNNKQNIELMEKVFKIGDRVVRSKGDYVVGRTGVIIDLENGRAQVDWDEAARSKVALGSIELTSTPYEIKPATEGKDHRGNYKFTYPKYVKL